MQLVFLDVSYMRVYKVLMTANNTGLQYKTSYQDTLACCILCLRLLHISCPHSQAQARRKFWSEFRHHKVWSRRQKRRIRRSLKVIKITYMHTYIYTYVRQRAFELLSPRKQRPRTQLSAGTREHETFPAHTYIWTSRRPTINVTHDRTHADNHTKIDSITYSLAALRPMVDPAIGTIAALVTGLRTRAISGRVATAVIL